MSHPEFLLHSSHRDEIWVANNCHDLHAVGMLYNAYQDVFFANIYPYFAPNGAFLKFGMTHVCE